MSRSLLDFLINISLLLPRVRVATKIITGKMNTRDHQGIGSDTAMTPMTCMKIHRRDYLITSIYTHVPAPLLVSPIELL